MMEEEKVILPGEKWTEEYAKKVAKADFEAAENYRTANHDRRWMNAQLLYLAWVQKRTWEGTRIPRSSIPVYLAFQQIESLLPRVLGEIFGQSEWFDIEPLAGTSMEQVRQVKALMLSQDENISYDPSQKVKIREIYRRALKSAFIYGNGIVEQGWIKTEKQRTKWVNQPYPQMASGIHPMFGTPMQAPTGVMIDNYVKQPIVDRINKPFLSYIPLTDFYIDPNCPSPNVKEARFCARRALKTIDEIMGMKDQPGFKIPGRDELFEMSKNKPFTQGDSTKGFVEVGKMGWWSPHVDQSYDPAAKRVEVISYWTKERLVWILNRDKVIYNDINPYGYLPFYNFFYTDVLDRFYAIALTDVLEGEQRVQEAIINGRMDELALSIHTPMAKKRGVSISPYQLRRRPDQVMEVEDVKDIMLLPPNNVTQQAFMEVNLSESRAEKATGLSDIAVLGAPSQGNSANRTATGINTQANATSARIKYLVETTENCVIEPMLEDRQKLNQEFLDPNEQMIVQQGQQQMNVDAMQIANADVKFKMLASGRMAARVALMQAFPMLSQTLLNPQFLDMMAKQQQQTINIKALSNIMLDALQLPGRDELFRPLSQEELQNMNQPPAEETTKREMQSERLEAQGEHAEMKIYGDMLKEMVKGSLKTKLDDAKHHSDIMREGMKIAASKKESKNERE